MKCLKCGRRKVCIEVDGGISMVAPYFRTKCFDRNLKTQGRLEQDRQLLSGFDKEIHQKWCEKLWKLAIGRRVIVL